jgi:uncharacterized membrane protein YsdA (DUF1294 family)
MWSMQILATFVAAWAILNILTFGMFWIDKNAAINGVRRIPESTLLGPAFWGGSVGATLGQRFLRHKTVKEPFRSRLRLINALHVLLLIGACILAVIPGAPAHLLALIS